ncbi:MAG: AAA family ATPase [Candidatus Promineifilaceae bacterium]
MSQNKRARQALAFREKDVTRLLRLAVSAESASLIGLSGVGKSNLFHHLSDPAVQQHYNQADDPNDYIFVKVNFHYAADYSDRSIYSLILEQFELLEDGPTADRFEKETFTKIQTYHDTLIEAQNDLLKVQRQFKLAVRALLGRSERKLVLVFDQFDELYREATQTLFSNLRGLRETYKYRLCYFLFTRGALIGMGEMDRHRDEFYELVAANIIGLKPYNAEDARRTIDRICTRNKWIFDGQLFDYYSQLSGGHAGLLRALLIASYKDAVPVLAHVDVAQNVTRLLKHENIESECEKIWISLALDEQELLLSGRFQTATSQSVGLRYLLEKGVLTRPNRRNLTIFSRLLEGYIDSLRGREYVLHINEAAQRVTFNGNTITNLEQIEYCILVNLYQKRGHVVPYSDIIASLPNNHPDATYATRTILHHVHRLNQKIYVNLIHLISNQGFRLE